MIHSIDSLGVFVYRCFICASSCCALSGGVFICRSPTASGRDPNEVFSLPSNRRPVDTPPVIPPRLSPESAHVNPAVQANPTPRSLFSEGLLARISQDPLFSRLLRPSSVDHNSGRNNGHHSSEQRSSSLFGRRISSEGLPLRR